MAKQHFKILQCEGLLLFLVFYYCRLNVFGFLTVKETINWMICEVVIGSFHLIETFIA